MKHKYNDRTAGCAGKLEEITEAMKDELSPEDPNYEWRKTLRWYASRKYLVQVADKGLTQNETGWLYISIRNEDRSSRHDWREFQDIKNQIAGEERIAIELYPEESRKVDEANQFHLFVLPEGSEIPIGFAERNVSYMPEVPNSSQRGIDGVDRIQDRSGQTKPVGKFTAKKFKQKGKR